jgi:hypothetical protein
MTAQAIAGVADELTWLLLRAVPPSLEENIGAFVSQAAAAGRTGARYRVRKAGEDLETALFEALGPGGGPARAIDPEFHRSVGALIGMFELSAGDAEWELTFGLDAGGRMALLRTQRIEPNVSMDDYDLVELDQGLMWRMIRGQAVAELKEGTLLIAGVFGQEIVLWWVLGGLGNLFVRALDVIAGRVAYPLIRQAVRSRRGVELLRAFRRAPAPDQEALAVLKQEVEAGRMSFSSDLQRRCRAAFDFIEEFLRANPPMGMPKAVPRNLADEAIKQFATRSIRFGQRRVLVTPKDMHHFLTRHHPNYWIGQVNPIQTFFNKNLTIDQLMLTLEVALRENAEKVIAAGAGEAHLLARVGQVDYAIVIRGERVVQFFPAP